MKKILLLLALSFFMVSCHHRPTTMDSLMQSHVEFDGTYINYLAYGHGTQTLVFVHGLGCDLHTWEAQFAHYAASTTTRLIFIDLPGFGASGKPQDADYTLSYFASAIDAVMRAEKVGEAVFVGHSLGTPVVRQYCFAHPDKVQALVDVDGVYVLLPADSAAAVDYLAAMEGFAGGFCQDDVSGYFQGFVASLAGPETPQFVTDYAMAHMPKTPGYVACSTMRNLIDMGNWTGEVIDKPTWVVCTRNSGIEPDNQARMQALYSNLTYSELETCGHFIHMEGSDWFNQQLDAFLQTLE